MIIRYRDPDPDISGIAHYSTKITNFHLTTEGYFSRIFSALSPHALVPGGTTFSTAPHIQNNLYVQFPYSGPGHTPDLHVFYGQPPFIGRQ
jgi:hypothetical protein